MANFVEYVKQLWDTTARFGPTRMNHIEDGIKNNSNGIVQLNSDLNLKGLKIAHIWNGKYSSTIKESGSIGNVTSDDYCRPIEDYYSRTLIYLFKYGEMITIPVTKYKENGSYIGSVGSLSYGLIDQINIFSVRYRSYGGVAFLIDPMNKGCFLSEDNSEQILTDIYAVYI